MKILLVFGTRPEAIKMAPLIHILKENSFFNVKVCVTAQHREMLDQVLDLFEIQPDYDLNLMAPNQTLESLTAKIMVDFSEVLDIEKPDLVLVHGDVTTGVASAMASFYKKIPVGHIEAGLRTGDIFAPWPEEMNRRLIGQMAAYHFAPTETARNNLLKENIPEDNIFVTGNSVIDALLYISEKIKNDLTLQNELSQKFSFLNKDKKLILMTGHRRENFDGGLTRVCETMANIAKRDDIEILYAVHMNPHVRKVTQEYLSDFDNIFLTEPQQYLPFIYLMGRSHIIVSDSGGIQEEAPSLGKPVLVTRDTTERPEAVAAGTVKLVGTNPDLIYDNVRKLLDDAAYYTKMSEAHNPYGDGKASKYIADHIKNAFKRP